MDDAYQGREQTKAKHFILRTYLQALAFKVLNGPRGWSALTYIDGFSGPWETRAADHTDSSFMIAINVLKDAQDRIFNQTGVRKPIHCFFSENIRKNFSELEATVRLHHDPSGQFFIDTYYGNFEDALPRIETLIGNSFALFFIDPTGWTGYSLKVLAPYIKGRSREVLINFMYDHINRFKDSPDPKTIESLNPILGGEGWQDKLSLGLPRGLAVEKLFRDELKQAGEFSHVLSTCIDKATVNRPHFFLTYGTKNLKGVETFRDVEANALKAYDRDRISAKLRKRSERTNMDDLFADDDTDPITYDEVVAREKKSAEEASCALLEARASIPFDELCATLLEAFMIRVTHVKDICVSLYKAGLINKNWEKQKPKSGDIIIRKPEQFH